MKRRLLMMMAALVVGLVTPCWITGAMAAPLSVEDTQAIQAAVQSQLDAFAEDDAVGAFALVTPATRIQFGNPDNFLHMVKTQYSPVYRHRLALFSGPEVIDGTTIQVVRLADRDGYVWLAVYRMQQETDGNWKIDGCQLLETTSVSI